jgi:TAT (twin-arginine translocation) pathway signal sequence
MAGVRGAVGPSRELDATARGRTTLASTRDVTLNRRKLLGASAAAGAATVLGGVGGPGRAVAAPARRSRQETTKLTF